MSPQPSRPWGQDQSHWHQLHQIQIPPDVRRMWGGVKQIITRASSPLPCKRAHQWGWAALFHNRPRQLCIEPPPQLSWCQKPPEVLMYWYPLHTFGWRPLPASTDQEDGCVGRQKETLQPRLYFLIFKSNAKPGVYGSPGCWLNFSFPFSCPIN